MDNLPLVSVVIVNWNGIEDTKECLSYIKEQTYTHFEVIVVDNGSRDGSVGYLRKLDDIHLVENHKNEGFTGGHIAGYMASKGDYILLLNNDAIMSKDYLEKAVSAMIKDPDIGAIGGRAYLWDETNPLFDKFNKFYAYQNINIFNADGLFTQSDAGVPQIVNNVSGSCVLVRRKVIDKVGYLHKPFFAYYEESDLFARMKRAGYKIIYDPNLAIWHANAKSTNKQAPTFFYYMIMRNRFRFAVRNFDSWSLRRFLKFYLKMGIASLIRTITDKKQGNMHRGYAKAFLYNMLFFGKAFHERRNLRLKLGKSNYNQLIAREQNGISIVVRCSSKKDIEGAKTLTKMLTPLDEIVLIVSDKQTGDLQNIDEANIRLCIDKGYFDAHSENLGVVCAKNDWIVISTSIPSAVDLELLQNCLYGVLTSSKALAIISQGIISSTRDVFKAKISNTLLIRRDLFISNHGLNKNFNLSSAFRELILFALATKNLYLVDSSVSKEPLQYFSNSSSIDDVVHGVERKVRAAEDHQYRILRLVDRLTTKYYRLYQLRNLVAWTFSPKISTRLKAARGRNLIKSLLALNKNGLAVELKHISNEVVMSRSLADTVATKNREAERLDYLRSHPEETVIYIILRDRYESLKKLLNWIRKEGLKKVVFIDNDSSYPPLVNFLNKTEYQVLELKRNMTQTAPWSAGVVEVLTPEDFYIVTDPDIVPTRQNIKLLPHLYDVHKKYPFFMKVGLGLKIDDLPDYYPLKKEVIKWETQFWKNALEDGIYEAGVDTTFALYKPYTYTYMIHSSLRTGEPYTARHLPWYENSKKLSEEEIFYRMRVDKNITSWNVDELPERYREELAKIK